MTAVVRLASIGRDGSVPTGYVSMEILEVVTRSSDFSTPLFVCARTDDLPGEYSPLLAYTIDFVMDRRSTEQVNEYVQLQHQRAAPSPTWANEAQLTKTSRLRRPSSRKTKPTIGTREWEMDSLARHVRATANGRARRAPCDASAGNVEQKDAELASSVTINAIRTVADGQRLERRDLLFIQLEDAKRVANRVKRQTAQAVACDRSAEGPSIVEMESCDDDMGRRSVFRSGFRQCNG